MTQRFVTTEKQREAAAQAVATHALPFTLAIAKGAKRTAQQNHYIHLVFASVAAQRGMTPSEMKAQCNREYGVKILRRDDPDFCAVWDYMFEPLPYEKQLVAMRRLDIPVTRKMNTKQLAEYIDGMTRDLARDGISYPDPEALKYEAEFNEPNR